MLVYLMTDILKCYTVGNVGFLIEFHLWVNFLLRASDTRASKKMFLKRCAEKWCICTGVLDLSTDNIYGWLAMRFTAHAEHMNPDH